MSFVNLNVKSGYSFLKSTLKVIDLIGDNASYEFLALTDENALFGIAEFIKLCESKNVKPIIGMEIKVNDNEHIYPLVLLAKNIDGYKSLCSLTSIVSKEDLSISIAKEELFKHSNGLVAILPTMRYQIELKDSELKEYKEHFDFYIGLECYKDSDLEAINGARVFAKTFAYKLTVISEVKTDCKESLGCLDILKSIDELIPVSEIEKDDNIGRYYRSEKELLQYFTKEELDSTYAIASSCVFNVYESQGNLVSYPLKSGVSSEEYLRALCQKGLEKRFNNKIDDRYQKRLNYELDVISKMGFTNYFLVVWDYVKYSKQHDIFVGPGRGSAAGSLTSFVLGITNIDPIKHNLLFERFLNPERVSMPDIDIDFIDVRRDEVIEYLTEKYGADRTAHVIAFQTFGAKQALRDACKAYGLPLYEIDDIAKKLPHIYNASLEVLVKESPSFKSLINSKKKYKEIYDTALKLEGLPRQTTLHAAGMIINNDLLANVTPIYKPSSDVVTTQYSMNYLEDFGLLKMDLLGIKFGLIDDCLKEIKKRGKDLDLYRLDFEDKNIYKLLEKGKTAGIFQLESAGMKRAIRIIRPSCFEDVVALLALFRPGPMDSIPTFANRKHGKEKVDYIDPCLEEILKSTYGIIIYQEQIMQILVTMAGFSLGQADIVRRAISKKKADKLAAIESDFIKGCLKNGHSKATAEKVFKIILQFAGYGFNKAHSVSYSMIAVWMLYLKFYHPDIFYVSLLNNYNDDTKFVEYCNELKSSGMRLLPPSINNSKSDFYTIDKEIVFGFRKIKGLTPGIINAILEARKNGEFKSFTDFVVRTHYLGLQEKHYDALIYAGAFSVFGVNKTTLSNNIPIIIQYAEIVSTNNDGQISFDLSLSPEPILTPYKEDRLVVSEKEKEILGIYLTSFPLQYDRKKLESAGFISVAEALEINDSCKIVGIISQMKIIKTKKGDYMAHLKITDETESINVTVFPKEYTKYEAFLKKGNYIQILGNVEEKDNNVSLLLKQAKIYNLKEE